MKKIPICDSHCHLGHYLHRVNSLNDVRDVKVIGGLDESTPVQYQIESIVAGVHPADWSLIEELPLSCPPSSTFAAYGLHPWHADKWNADIALKLEQYLRRGAVAVGEIGLDGSIGLSAEIQERAFRQQVALAVKYNLPVILHCHKGLDRLFTILEEEKVVTVGGVLHGFTGSIETANRAIGNGLALGIGKAINWPSAKRLKETVTFIDAEWLVLESDYPDSKADITVDGRGCLLSNIARTVGVIRGWTIEETFQRTRQNAYRVFGLDNRE